MQAKSKKTYGGKGVPPFLPEAMVYPPRGLDRMLQKVVLSLGIFTRYMLVFFAGIAVMALALLLCFGAWYAQIVSDYSQTNVVALARAVFASRSLEPQLTNGRKNLLILGTDILQNRDTDSVRTDTIVIVSVGVPRGDVKLIALPRDLWIASQSAKINATFQPDKPVREQILPDVIHGITGLSIHHMVVIDLQTVRELIDVLGGIEVQVHRAFVDTQFPRTDVDVRVISDPKQLYETVVFTEGKEIMSGERVLQYIRSRHSPDPLEGSDEGRVRRQQQVIAALIARLEPTMLIRQPETIGKLLGIYSRLYAQVLTVQEISALGWKLVMSSGKPQVQSYQLPIRGTTIDPVLMHPTDFPGGAWVYLPILENWSGVRDIIARWIQAP